MMDHCELCQPSGHIIFSAPQWRVVLVDDANYPGFCRVIWHEHIREMTDLVPAQRQLLMDVVWLVETVLREVLQPHKINLASFGNVVPHLHWHVIPRFEDDVHFPNPVWGKIERGSSAAHRLALLPVLEAELKSRLAVIGVLRPAG